MRRTLMALALVLGSVGAAQARETTVGEFKRRCYPFGISGTNVDLAIHEKHAIANERFCYEAALTALRAEAAKG